MASLAFANGAIFFCVSMVLFLFLFSFATWAGEPEIFQSSEWLALLHYKNGRSIVSATSFFLASDGQVNALAEGKANRDAFLADPTYSCRFPARALFFEKLGLSARHASTNDGQPLLPQDNSQICARWMRWKQAIRPSGISLVFATGYVSSPSSMYGHTFLKFTRSETQGQYLLDHSLSFGANTGNSGGLAYLWNGLTGGFDGFFTVTPFYIQVKEYNKIENRDFWIYPLQAKQNEVDYLLAHAWELQGVAFPYFFLKRNCSYYLLEFLSIIYPNENLLQKFPLWAIPVDTIRALNSKSLLQNPTLVPSQWKVLQKRKQSLGANEVQSVDDFFEKNHVPKSNNAILAAYDLLRYRYPEKVPEQEKTLLQAMASAQDTTMEFIEPAPHEGHRTGRIAFVVGREKQNFLALEYRGALHDLLASGIGYEPFSELFTGDLQLRWQNQKMRVEKFDLLKIRSVPPTTSWVARKSWKFELGLQHLKQFVCNGCLVGNLASGLGMATGIGPLDLFGMVTAQGQVGSVLNKKYRISSGPEFGLWLPISQKIKFLTEANYFWALLGDKTNEAKMSAGLSYALNINWQIRTQATVAKGYREWALGSYWYF